jgi:hypothetical protein
MHIAEEHSIVLVSDTGHLAQVNPRNTLVNHLSLVVGKIPQNKISNNLEAATHKQTFAKLHSRTHILL